MTKTIVALLWLSVHGGQNAQAALSINTTVHTREFDDEIEPPSSANLVRIISDGSGGQKVGYIKHGSWVCYSNFNFGLGATNFAIEAGSGISGSTIEIWLNARINPDRTLSGGTKVGAVTVTDTGGTSSFRWFSTALSPQPSGTNRLFLKCVNPNNTGYLFDTRNFIASGPVAPVQKGVGVAFHSVDFDLESAPGTAPIQANGDVLEAIADQSWVAYRNFNFGAEANRFSIEATTPGAGGRIELRLGSQAGLLVGTVDVRHTGSEVHYQDFGCVLTRSVSGTNDLYLKFVDAPGGGGELFKARECVVWREVPALGTSLVSDEDSDGSPALLEYATGMHPQSRDTLPLSLKPEANDPAVDFQLRVRAEEGVVTRLLVTTHLAGGSWQAVTLLYTNGNWQTDHAQIGVGQVVSNGAGLYTVQLENGRTGQSLFARLAAEKKEGRLHVYPPVPGLGMTPGSWASLPKDDWTESPYYTYGIQKISQLNHTNFAEATHWETPYAFFTRCIDYDPNVDTAYFDEYVGGWSHTYCNVELDPHTPIVIRIHRRTQAEMAALGIVSDAPKGPITSAVAYPTRKVDSCQVLNGDVYVTLSNPALIAVDIDRQMDGRDAPRNLPFTWGTAPFPYKYESNGTHAVTIFANPVIEDKPNINDTANVRVVQPGQKPPTSFSQSILYFAPGVHKLSVDANGNPRELEAQDILRPINGKSYYIPGNAIVYGMLNDNGDSQLSKDIRVFGHGTLSGRYISHFKDYTYPSSFNIRMISIDDAENVVYEGITLANPPEHTVKIYGQYAAPNYAKWLKTISWRVNNDGITVTGNSYIEDCFIRHQDDGSYIRGMGIRRTTYWSDVNGTALRGSFLTRDRDDDYPSTLSPYLFVEDCDILYSRAVFAGSRDKALRTAMMLTASLEGNATHVDGTKNTGQHLIIRNLTISDPRPQRVLFSFFGAPYMDGTNVVNHTGAAKGLSFENVNQMHPNTWGLPNTLTGDADSEVKYWTFKNVRINGALLDAALLANPAVFTTTNVSGMIFQP